MNEQRRETYLTLIQSLLNSPKDEQITILQTNLELLDDGFAQYLREWATPTLAAMESEEAYNFADNLYSFNITISSFPLGSRAANIEIAIACLEVGLIIFTLEADSEKWGMFQNSLGIKYSDRIREDKAENIEKAIACYELALEVRTRAASPQQWAMTQNNLATAYSDRIREDKAENIEKAIACYELALEVYTRAASPQDWATTQNNLAIAYSDRIREDKAENIEKAIACYELALEVYTPTALPIECLIAARSLGNLGFAESLWETAIFGYEKAIEAVEQSREWITSDNRKREIIEENLNVYEKMMQSCINHQQYHKAIQTIERSKSRYLVELFTNSEIYPKTATATEKQQLRDLRSQIASLQKSLETQTPISPPPTPVSPLPPPLTKGGPGGVPDSPSQRTTQTRPHTPELSQQQEKLVTALQQLEQYLENFKQREPEFKLTQKIQPIDINKFQKTLDPKTAIIEWYIGNNSNSNSPLLKGGRGGSEPSITNNSNSDDSWGGFAFILTQNNIELITYTTTEIAELETWKDNYLNQYRDQKTNKTWQQTLSQKLEQLSQILRLNEIVAKIPTTSQQLILVPHRYLHLFPLHALPLEGGHAPSTAPTDSGGHGGTGGHAPSTAPTRNLLDGFPDGVKYAPSLQLLELVKNRINTRKSTAKNQQQLFALQNPTEDLFNADMEVETIKTGFNSHQILLRKQATKIALNQSQENLVNSTYLHFSCHGVFEFDYPLQSSLVLADSLEPVLEINPPPTPPC
ncbi:MAG: tetratricopeptide repeat protein [Microcoleus anatoxicus]|uniref:CHAT domain-containing protein n=1 Tax=Microcoleus anatoxicus TaxID=2705319 RepID=UPI0036728659